jgi:hypothetical protein
MKRAFRLALVFAAVQLIAPAWAQTKKTSQEKSDGEIKQEIIALSIASYSGSCPCPHNTDRGGRKCGRRSAYSRPGGKSPFCYEEDVTAKMVQEHRKRAKR